MSETTRVLTKEEVAVVRMCRGPLLAPRDVVNLCDSHELLRAQLAAAERERDEARAALSELRGRHEVACDTITALQHARESSASWQALSSLSSWLGQGMGDKRTSADEFEKRIREGVESHLRVQETVFSELATLRAQLSAAEARAAQAEHGKPLALYRCRVCGARWLFWVGELKGLKPGTWSLLDSHQRPGSCCDNASMGDQMEFLRDIIARWRPSTDTQRGGQPNP